MVKWVYVCMCMCSGVTCIELSLVLLVFVVDGGVVCGFD